MKNVQSFHNFVFIALFPNSRPYCRKLVVSKYCPWLAGIFYNLGTKRSKFSECWYRSAKLLILFHFQISFCRKAIKTLPLALSPVGFPMYENGFVNTLWDNARHLICCGLKFCHHVCIGFATSWWCREILFENGGFLVGPGYSVFGIISHLIKWWIIKHLHGPLFRECLIN